MKEIKEETKKKKRKSKGMEAMMILYGKYGTRILYENHVFVWIHDFEYGNFEYGSVCMDISGSISSV